MIKLLEAMSRAASKNALVQVGFIDRETYPATVDGNPVFVAQVAFWNNYGTSKTPPRPFFNQMIAKNSSSWGGDLAKLLKANKMDVVTSLGQMGEVMHNQLKQSIIDFEGAPLAGVTVARKGFAKPLIDSARMARNIGYKVIL